MNTALKFSYKIKILKKSDYDLILDHIYNSKLPFNLKNYFSLNHLNKILIFILKDKKNKFNKINLILLKKIGFTSINKSYNKSEIKSFLKNELSN